MSAEENRNFVPDDLSNYKVVRKGNLVINKMKAWQGSLGIAPMDGLVSPAYFVFDIGIGDRRFGQTLLRSRPYVAFLASASDGVRIGQWDLSIDRMKRIPVLVPPLPEQSGIVRFLDHFDRRTRRYIRAKQRLISLLEEQKQAIIHRVATRGLDPNARLKPSGVEWLGDVPWHWQVSRIGRFARVGNGSTPSRANPSYWSGGQYPWLNSSFANLESVAHADQFVTDAALRECHLPIVPAGSVLVAITGQGKTRGKATVLRIEATINQHMAYLTPRPAMCSAEFLRLALTAAYAQLRAISDDSGSTKGALTCADIKRFEVALPPLAEQDDILASIGSQTQLSSQAIERAHREIFLLRELRTRLVADVVTGKLDVREAAASFPDEPTALDQLDHAEPEHGEEPEAEALEADDIPEEAEV
jgi:type I restriction enzyme S subunit